MPLFLPLSRERRKALTDIRSHRTVGKNQQFVRKVIDISDSTLYPVLRRLQKDQCLMVYDLECAGRNRRYYKVTEQGLAQLGLYKEEWKRYSSNISMVFEGGINNES